MTSVSFPLDYLAVLQISGEDTLEFLQGQLTADVRQLGPENPVFACVCNPKGRVIGVLLLSMPDANSVLAVCSRELAQGISSHLARYVLRSRVKISQRDDLLVCAAPGAVEAHSSLFLVQPATGGPYALVPCGLEPEPSMSMEGNRTEWQGQEMRQGIHWLDQKTAGEFLPQMLGLQAIGALSFTKGCYPGQEVIARTRHLGRLKRHPVLCLAGGLAPVHPMDEVVLHSDSEKATAVVVKAVPSSQAETMIMLVARTPEGFSAERLECVGTEFTVTWSATPGPA